MQYNAYVRCYIGKKCHLLGIDLLINIGFQWSGYHIFKVIKTHLAVMSHNHNTLEMLIMNQYRDKRCVYTQNMLHFLVIALRFWCFDHGKMWFHFGLLAAFSPHIKCYYTSWNLYIILDRYCNLQNIWFYVLSHVLYFHNLITHLYV